MRITNLANVSLPLATWLLSDDYDYIDAENYISVTGLMKPLKQAIMASRIPADERTADVTEFAARTLGHSIHDSMEKVWTKGGYKRAMRLLGYPQEVIDRIRVNPTDDERRASNSIIPVFTEQRAFREIDGYSIGGKFDLVADGIANDTKSTSVFAYMAGNRDDDHILQLSLYRWIDAVQPMPKITADYGVINYVFTDWQGFMARGNPSYPQQRTAEKELPLLDLADCEDYVRSKLAMFQKYKHLSESEIPECSDAELWRQPPQHKFFLDPAKANEPGARCSKNFKDDAAAAREYQASKGGRGVIKVVPGAVKACGYCGGFDACTQKDRYEHG